MGRHLLYLAVICCLVSNACLMELNSICRDGPVAWRCKNTDNCDTLDKDDTVQICGFNGRPLVCCPPPQSNSPPRRVENDNNRFNNSSRN